MRNPESTRTRILETARSLFAQNGFYGTSTAQIVNASGCNKRMLYHYFSDKEGLYREVHECLWKDFSSYMQPYLDSASNDPDLKEKLIEIMGVYFDYYSARPDFVRLSMWQSLEGGKILNELWEKYRGPLSKKIITLLERGKALNIISGEVRSNHLLLSLLGANHYYLIFHETLDEILGTRALDESALEIRREQFLLILKNLFVD